MRTVCSRGQTRAWFPTRVSIWFALAYTPNDARNYDYSGVTLECEMTVELKDVSELTADAIPAQTYTVSALTPEVMLRRWRCGTHRGYGLYRNLRQ